MTIAAGIDVGTGTVKAALFRIENGKEEWLSRSILRIRQRDPMELAEEAYEQVLEDAGLTRDDVHYVATTGEGEAIPFHTGHFYSMTTHARGALHGRAILVDGRGKVITYKMTSQCASGSGQFLENIARYLGIAQDEICAVLAETDVINMVSRGISTPNILKGIHLSMASRLARLLKSIGVKDGTVMVTGGLAADEALREELAKMKSVEAAVENNPDSIYAGTIDAALWGGFRHEKLAEIRQLPMAS